MDNSKAEALRQISPDRKRTNLLRDLEQPTIAFLCRIMPPFISPNMLTVLGLLASLIIFLGFWLGRVNPFYLGISIFGFVLQWFGDSLDGRIAYYRKIPRKWYGFALDLCMDWISTVLMGMGFYFYLNEPFKILAFLFIAAYAWIMLLTLLKYKITNNYSIDSGLLGPTELRIGICGVLLAAMFYPMVITWFAMVLIGVIFIINLIEFNKVLELGNQLDREENGKQQS